AYDHFGHLRPVKNLCFWWVANDAASLPFMRALSLLAALACAWLVRSVILMFCASPPLAAASAALWLLNPTTAVGVSWLSASNYLFALLGVLFYLKLIERPTAGRFALAHVALLFAALSHELALLTPLWALVLCRQRGSSPGSGSRALWGAALVLAVPLALRLSATAPELAYRTKLPALQLVASAAYNFVQNLRLWVWLSGRFGVLLSQTAELNLWLSIGAWLGTICAAWLVGKSARLPLGWVLLFLLPVINLVPLGITPVATHYLILPGVGLAWLSALALERVARRSPRHFGLAAIALIVCWQPAFRQTVRAYQSDIALYEATLASYPDNTEARVNLIAAYTETGQSARAQELLQQALARTPDHPGLLKLQLLALLQNNRSAEAQAWFERHRDHVQRDPDLSLRRALLLRSLGRNAEAEQGFEHVLRIATEPDIRATAGYQLANLQVQTGRLAEAQALLGKLHRELPDNPDIKLALRLIDDVLRRPVP
ncbi:MAG TPA: tetratricopeptide repeat protein, partial [Polyangiales bacterium]|nr:tetratricopeptide repeat protein [Polyangiales bacterium]